jgi:hypothetical protein
MVTKSQPDSVLKDKKERLIKPREAMDQVQSALFWYSDGPSDIVPELVPLDGWHRQPPEHVTVAALTDWYLPASHTVHGPPLGPIDPVLQVQLVKAALPAGELEFDGQARHVELADAPTAVEYVPAPQSVQVAVPDNSLYFPGTHATHTSPFGPVDPVLQVQLVKAVLPAGELEFDGQAMHVKLGDAVAVPVNTLYVPATHAELLTAHGPPFGPVDPVLQVQLVKAALPAGELAFDGQALHVELAAAPTAVEYVPAPQSVQVVGQVTSRFSLRPY